MAPPKSAFSRLLDHFHSHPRGRLHEMFFWGGLGLVLGAFAWFGYQAGWLSEPIAWLVTIVAVCLVGFAVLPHPTRKQAVAPLPKGKRGEIAQRKLDNKSAKRRGPGPPIQ